MYFIVSFIHALRNCAATCTTMAHNGTLPSPGPYQLPSKKAAAKDPVKKDGNYRDHEMCRYK